MEDPFEEVVRGVFDQGSEASHDQFASALWRLGRGEMNGQMGDGILKKYVVAAVYETIDGGQVFRLVCGDGSGTVIPPWDAFGLIEHAKETLRSPGVVFMSPEDPDGLLEP